MEPEEAGERIPLLNGSMGVKGQGFSATLLALFVDSVPGNGIPAIVKSTCWLNINHSYIILYHTGVHSSRFGPCSRKTRSRWPLSSLGFSHARICYRLRCRTGRLERFIFWFDWSDACQTGTTALDTLGSSSFASGNRPADLSVHFQRCVILLYILFIPVAFLWTFMEPVLLSLGQPPTLCRDVQAYLRVLIIGAPGFIGFESLKKYLLAQREYHERTWEFWL